MNQINFPKLYCPFPAAVNRHAESVNQHTLTWVKRFKLVPNENEFDRLVASKFGWLAARAYPNAPLQELEIVSDWNTWLFIRDDQCDESGIGKDPVLLTRLHDQLLEILTGRKPDNRDPALAHALHDLCERILNKASPEWMCRFVHSVIEYFESSVWEAQNRALGLIPDMETYMLMRPYTGGLYTDIELIDITENIHLPLHVRKHETVQRLALLTNNVVCWSNDIISFAKETRHNDVHNLVVILRKHHLTLQEAIDQATELTNEEVRAFELLQDQLPSFSPAIDADLQRFVSVLRSWMRGNLDWAYDSGRYRTNSAESVMGIA
jgi:5-epi-alpha-selinene synthase